MLTRRGFLTAAGGALTVLSSGAVEVAEPLRVGLLTFVPPEGWTEVDVPSGWDWAADAPEGVRLLVRGRTACPTPELALTMVLAPTDTGIFTLRLVSHPPQGVAGADAYRVWNVASTAGEPRTGSVVAATLGSKTAVALLTGPDGWSPSTRRSTLASLAVSTDA